MKTNIIKALLLALPMVGFVTACSDDDDYTPAETPNNHQVYFNYQDNNTFSIEENQSSVSVAIYRIKTDDDLTVSLSSTQPEGQTNIFNVPSTVTFAKGENKTDLVIGLDFASIVPKTTYNLSIAVDPSETSIYGDSSTGVVVEYYEKGDPLRDAVCGYYGGTQAGYEYYTNSWYGTYFSYEYGSNAVDPVRILQGEARDEVLIRNLIPSSSSDWLTVNDLVGKVVTTDEYSSYEYESDYGITGTVVGYILMEPQDGGNFFVSEYWGNYPTTFAAAWSTGAYASAPTDSIYAYIIAEGSLADNSLVVKGIDFNSCGWALMFGYKEYGAWYYAVCGGGVVTPQQ